jgi:transketolase
VVDTASSAAGNRGQGRPIALKDILRRARLRLLKMHFESGVGHIGGNLSALDILLTLHHRVMRSDDQFVLSKGHAAGALYVTLWSLGRLTEEQLLTFHRDHTKLGGHPVPHGIPDIPFAIGSLGHGLGLAAGLALGKKLRGQPGQVFCLLSDGEWNEGSNWESLTFIAHRNLREVTLLVDLNGLQGFGSTVQVANLGSLANKLREFGFEVREIDGHDTDAIERALKTPATDRPMALVARTIKGHGVSFMENKMEWHYLPMTAEQYQMAVEEASRL